VLPQNFKDKSPSPKKQQFAGKEIAGYSADEFDSDTESNKTPLDLNKFAVSLGNKEADPDDILS
jgi:hypothetical protein